MSWKMLLAGLPAMLFCRAAVAAANLPADAPAETVDTIWVLVFGVLFVGMIVGFVVMLLRAEKKKTPTE